MIAEKLTKTEADYDTGVTNHLYHLETSGVEPNTSILNARERQQIVNDFEGVKRMLEHRKLSGVALDSYERYRIKNDIRIAKQIIGDSDLARIVAKTLTFFFETINKRFASSELRTGFSQRLEHVVREVEQLGQPSEVDSSNSETEDVIPTPQTITIASRFISRFYKLLNFYDHQLKTPHISVDLDGEISFTWWHNSKSLTFYIYPTGDVYFLKVWGPNIHNEMEDGTNPTDWGLIDLWRWLIL